MHEFESGFFVGEKAWHGLGKLLAKAPRTPAEALREAGLDWIVEERPISVPGVPATPGTWVGDYKALVRSTDQRVLSVVDPFYKPLQNADALKFFAPLVADKDCSFEAAGSLRGGRRIWVLAKINGSTADVGKGDPIEPYFLLANGHDTSLKVTLMFTAIRVVCMNTLKMALGRGAASAVKVLHSQKLEESLSAIREALDVSKQTFTLSVKEFRAMKARGLDVDGLKQYVRKVFAGEGSLDDQGDEKMPRCWETVEKNFEAGVGSKLAGSTVWGAYNAVTHFLDYQRGTSSATTEATRLDSTWFGEAARVRDRAHKEALVLVK